MIGAKKWTFFCRCERVHVCLHARENTHRGKSVGMRAEKRKYSLRVMEYHTHAKTYKYSSDACPAKKWEYCMRKDIVLFYACKEMETPS